MNGLMGPIKSVLKEELDNSLHLQKGYERELSKLPKGSLVKKRIKGHEYYYLVSREHGKVKFMYKGRVSVEDREKYGKTKDLRAKYRKLLSLVKKQVRFLRGSLRGKEPI